MKSILFVKIGALGDLTYALPAAQALKKATGSHLTWLVGKSYQSFLRGHAYIDELLTIDDKKLYSKNKFSRLLAMIKFIFNCHKRFDVVVIAHRDPLYYRFFKLFSRAAVFQLVRDKNKNPTRFIYVPPMQVHESMAIKKLTHAAALFCRPDLTALDWKWDYSHIVSADLAIPDNYIVLHLGGGLNSKTEFQLKCWPHWEELVLRLLAETNLHLVFIGSPAEEINFQKIAATIQQRFPARLARCFNLMNDLTLVQLADVIRRSQVFVGVDSGPLHIADSMDKNVIGLYGPTSPISWGLLAKNSHVFQHQVPCSPCYKDDSFFPACEYQHRCMQLLAVEPVFKKILAAIEIE
jgi:heptosyltransferase-1